MAVANQGSFADITNPVAVVHDCIDTCSPNNLKLLKSGGGAGALCYKEHPADRRYGAIVRPSRNRGDEY